MSVRFSRARRYIRVAAVASLTCILAGDALSDEAGTCTAKIRDIKKEYGETTILVFRGRECRTEVIRLRSKPLPPGCVAGATVTATGAWVTNNSMIPLIELAATTIACR